MKRVSFHTSARRLDVGSAGSTWVLRAVATLVAVVSTLAVAGIARAVTYRVAAGTYAGDDAPAHAISGLGFQPDLVFIKGERVDPSVIRTTPMTPGFAKRIGTNSTIAANLITSLDADGFTVGSDADVNSAASSYHWVAFEADPARLVVGSYVGDGVDNTHVAVGFQPTYVIVMSASNDEAVQRFAQQPVDQCLPFSGGPAFGDGIQNFDASGFEVGQHVTVNSPGTTYYYIAWAATPRVIADGTYTGDGAADRDEVIGFKPRFMIVNGTMLSQPAIARTDSMAADVCVYIDPLGSTLSDGIRNFNSNGFKLGSNSAANATGVTYYWTAFNSAMDLELSGAVDNAGPAEGDTLRYTWTLTNNGPGDATAVDVENILPSGLTYELGIASQGTYIPASSLWSAGGLASGASATLTIDAILDPGTSGSTISNPAHISAYLGAGDINAANDSTFVDVTVASVDLTTTKTVDDPNPAETDTIQFTITVTNNGPDPGTQVQVFDPLPAGLTYVTSAASVGSYNSGTGLWFIGNLANGANATLTLDTSVDLGTAGTTITNVANGLLLESDPVPADNVDSVDVDVSAIAPLAADLQVLKMIDNPTPHEGDFVRYTVTVRNNGPNPATGVEVTDVLPSQVTYQVHGTSHGTYDPGTGSWSLGGLLVDSTASLTLDVTINSRTGASSITNSAWVEAVDQADAVAANDTARVIVRTMEVQAIPLGSQTVLPGTPQVVLLALQVTNHAQSSNTLTDLTLNAASPLSFLRLWLDDGDLQFSAAEDALVRAGVPSAGTWSPTGMSLTMPVEEPVVLFVTGDVSSTASPHASPLTVSVANPSDLTWTNAASVVTNVGFPLRSPGAITVEDLALAQLTFVPTASTTATPGTDLVAVMQVGVPDNGAQADSLSRFEVQQVGSALATTDIERMRLLEMTTSFQDTTPPDPRPNPPDPEPGELPAQPKPGARVWKPVDLGELFHIGAGRWSTNGLAHPVPAGGTSLRVVVDIAAAARDGRTVQLQLPLSALEFTSGRRGPEDAAWTNPDSVVVRANNTLDVVQTAVTSPGAPVPRGVGELPVLGLELTARSSTSDTLTSLRLVHVSSGPVGFATDPHAQVQAVELWLDVDRDGARTGSDTLLEAVAPNGAGELLFGATTPLQVVLDVNQPVRLLATLTPHATLVRDAEQLRVRLEQASDVGTAGGLSVQMSGPFETSNPPIVDGQAANGYTVVPIAGGVLLSGAARAVALDITVPSNGVDPDVLEGLRVDNAGSALANDIAKMELFADDGDGTIGAGDTFVAELTAISKSSWEVTGLGVALPNDVPQRFLVTIDVSQTPSAGATFQARVPVNGISVFTGNDGPNDVTLSGGNALILSAADRVTWLAGVSGSSTVLPNARTKPVLVFEVFNGYSNARTLQSLNVTLTGTASDMEFGNWGLYPDEDENGLPDANALAVASPILGRVQFDVDYALAPQQQHRLLVTYDLAASNVRDGARVDAAVQAGSDIRYADGGTTSAASFPLDSPGTDTVDGFIRAQVSSRNVASRALGGGETDVLTLDFTLPSDGSVDDTLARLDLEHVNAATAAELGVDLTAVRLWRESDLEPLTGTFDPGADVPVAVAVDPNPPSATLRFGALSEPIASGGQRFYVTADVAASPTDGRVVHLRIPRFGVDMVSNNDGPLDAVVTGTAQHTFSSSDLLASVDVSPSFASRGQVVSVTVPVRNQGTTTLNGVIPVRMDVAPASAATLVAGPTPSSLTLAPAAEDVFTYQFQLDEIGSVQFTAQVALSDSSLPSDVVTSSLLQVVDPPSQLDLSMQSNLPPSVNRGQRVTPLVWRLSHPDPDSTSADVRVDSVVVRIQNAAGAPLPAIDALDDFEIRTGGIVHAASASIPSASELRIALEVPLVLQGGQTVELPFAVTIAAQAAADNVRFSLDGVDAVYAVDANNGQPVSVNAALPWNTEATTIYTRAVTLDVAPLATLPNRVNAGQRSIAAGRFELGLPGAVNESEARLVQLTVALQDSLSASIAPDQLLNQVVVRSGTTELLRTSSFQVSGGALVLPLTIPKLVVSGALETVELQLDLRSDPVVDRFSVVVQDSAALVVRDGPSGELVSVRLQSPAAFPWTQGPARVQSAATNVAVAASSLTPASGVPGQTNVRIAALELARPSDASDAADVMVRGLAFQALDDFGNVLVPADIMTTARVVADGALVPSTGSPPSTNSAYALQLVTPLALAPQDSLRVEIEVDLTSALAATQLRFGFETDALDVVDANDPSNVVPASGLPFATGIIRIVATPNRVALGPLADPPANVAPGATVQALTVRVRHPGAANEGPVQAQQLTFFLRDVAGAPLAWDTLISGATARVNGSTLTGTRNNDALAFDLSGAASLDTGDDLDVDLDLEILPTPSVADFRLQLDTSSLVATSGGTTLPTIALDGTNLPWLSPSLHITSQDLQSSFASYPNPFTPGRDGACKITFYLSEDARVTAEISTLTGRPVCTLLRDVALSAGLHDNVTWDGRNGNGDVVRSGTYLLRLTVSGARGAQIVRKLAVMR